MSPFLPHASEPAASSTHGDTADPTCTDVLQQDLIDAIDQGFELQVSHRSDLYWGVRSDY